MAPERGPHCNAHAVRILRVHASQRIQPLYNGYATLLSCIKRAVAHGMGRKGVNSAVPLQDRHLAFGTGSFVQTRPVLLHRTPCFARYHLSTSALCQERADFISGLQKIARFGSGLLLFLFNTREKVEQAHLSAMEKEMSSTSRRMCAGGGSREE